MIIKNILPIIALLALSTLTIGQSVEETLISFNKSYSPLFSKLHSQIDLEYVRRYDLAATDTTRAFTVSINTTETKSELSSISIGSLLGDVAVSSNVSIDRDKRYSFASLTLLDLETFVQCANKVYTLIGNVDMRGGKLKTSCKCGLEQIQLSGVYDPSKSEYGRRNFYIISDSAVFKMPKEDFENIVSLFSRALKDWQSK